MRNLVVACVLALTAVHLLDSLPIHADWPIHEPGIPFLIHLPDNLGDIQDSPDASGDVVVWHEYTPGGPPARIYGYSLQADTRFLIVSEHANDIRISGGWVIWQTGGEGGPVVAGSDIATGERFEIIPGIDPDIDARTIVFDDGVGVGIYDVQAAKLVYLWKQDRGYPRIADGLVAWWLDRQAVGIHHIVTGETRALGSLHADGPPTTNDGWVFFQTGSPPGILAYHWDTDTYLRISHSDSDEDAYLADNGTAVWIDQYFAIRAYNIYFGTRCNLVNVYAGAGNLNGDGNVVVWSQRLSMETSQRLVYAMVVPSLALVGRGDTNCNDRIDWPDISAHAIHWRMSDTAYDRDGDADTDVVDVQAVARRLGELAPHAGTNVNEDGNRYANHHPDANNYSHPHSWPHAHAHANADP